MKGQTKAKDVSEKEITKQEYDRSLQHHEQKGVDCSCSLPKQELKSHKMKLRSSMFT